MKKVSYICPLLFQQYEYLVMGIVHGFILIVVNDDFEKPDERDYMFVVFRKYVATHG